MDVKTWFLYISLGLFILQFTPFNFVLKSSYFSYTYIVANAYIIVFAIFVIVENYEKIKDVMGIAQSKSTNFIVFKNSNPKRDLIRFILISLTIALCLDVILTKLADQPLFEYISTYIPGLNEFKDLANLSITESFKNTIKRTQNITGNPGEIGNTGVMNVKIGDIKSISAKLIGAAAIGPIILFLLRQISYKKRRSNKPENPGARILFLFIVGTMILLIFDIYTDTISGFSSLSQNPEILANETSSDDKILVYGVRNIGVYFASFAPSPFYWITAISIWAFDWYLFSRIWSKDFIIKW